MPRYTSNGTTAVDGTADSIIAVADTGGARRGKLFEFTWGALASATAADVIVGMHVGRITTDGTAGSAVTAIPLDPADAAATATLGENYSTEPTYTANQEVFLVGRHMRATYRWVAAPGAEFVYPATDNNGFGFKPIHSSATHDEQVTMLFEE